MAGARADRSKKPYSRPTPRRSSDGEWLHDKAPNTSVPKKSLPGKANTPGTVNNAKLVVSNLHYEVTARDLTAIFGQIGTLVREPSIRYDRSGRSSGVAFVTFESSAEAKRALAEYNSKLCKGLPMSIAIAEVARPQARRNASTPSLINRIQKPPLLERLTQEESRAKSPTRTSVTPAGPGPIRNKPRAPKAPRAAKKPKTAEELDSELDAFMKDDTQSAPAVPGHAGDIEMTE